MNILIEYRRTCYFWLGILSLFSGMLIYHISIIGNIVAILGVTIIAMIPFILDSKEAQK